MCLLGFTTHYWLRPTHIPSIEFPVPTHVDMHDWSPASCNACKSRNRRMLLKSLWISYPGLYSLICAGNPIQSFSCLEFFVIVQSNQIYFNQHLLITSNNGCCMCWRASNSWFISRKSEDAGKSVPPFGVSRLSPLSSRKRAVLSSLLFFSHSSCCWFWKQISGSSDLTTCPLLLPNDKIILYPVFYLQVPNFIRFILWGFGSISKKKKESSLHSLSLLRRWFLIISGL